MDDFHSSHSVSPRSPDLHILKSTALSYHFSAYFKVCVKSRNKMEIKAQIL